MIPATEPCELVYTGKPRACGDDPYQRDLGPWARW